MRRPQQDGFTIVELLITIIVIAILAGISVVAYSGIRERALLSSVQSDLRTLGQAVSMYHAEEGQYPRTPGALGDALRRTNTWDLGTSSLSADGKAFGYCLNNGDALWIFSYGTLPRTNLRHYWSSERGGLGEVEFQNFGHTYTIDNSCRSVMDGRSPSAKTWSYNL